MSDNQPMLTKLASRVSYNTRESCPTTKYKSTILADTYFPSSLTRPDYEDARNALIRLESVEAIAIEHFAIALAAANLAGRIEHGASTPVSYIADNMMDIMHAVLSSPDKLKQLVLTQKEYKEVKECIDGELAAKMQRPLGVIVNDLTENQKAALSYEAVEHLAEQLRNAVTAPEEVLELHEIEAARELHGLEMNRIRYDIEVGDPKQTKVKWKNLVELHQAKQAFLDDAKTYTGVTEGVIHSEKPHEEEPQHTVLSLLEARKRRENRKDNER